MKNSISFLQKKLEEMNHVLAIQAKNISIVTDPYNKKYKSIIKIEIPEKI